MSATVRQGPRHLDPETRHSLFTEEGADVEIEALLAIPGTDVTDFCSEVYPQTMTV
jgi:hypothetical protein